MERTHSSQSKTYWPKIISNCQFYGIVCVFSPYPGYKEGAFAYAIAAAGVAYNIARGCSQGRILSCGCDPYIKGLPEFSQKMVDFGKERFLHAINNRVIESEKIPSNKK